MGKERQISFSADTELLKIIDERRGDVTRSLFIRKTLAIALGVDNKVGIDLFYKESPRIADTFRKSRTKEEVLTA